MYYWIHTSINAYFKQMISPLTNLNGYLITSCQTPNSLAVVIEHTSIFESEQERKYLIQVFQPATPSTNVQQFEILCHFHLWRQSLLST